MDYALRLVESIAFSIHSILGITEPCHGAGSWLAEDSLPKWFWAVAGLLLSFVALANFSDRDAVVLGAQAYIATFHSGAVFWHVRLDHHPVAGVAPGVFVFIAFVVTALRLNVWIALLGTVVCAAAGVLLGCILVTPPVRERPLVLG
eukprot:CAMPEP_0179079930 /NCGR_PEP_ID=MMETSP0796-20121207/35894_1 /TAXON_ID=73915 /ORGANISM="Pyrodinium bahamense, Strain pbaha01" /LENGTH=146 /DNA_ID=CAMNT_0020777277 /DNA_START=26 /DNA_END=466 /DNA_ORIENTATION=-